jgi:hypothetical protein
LHSKEVPNTTKNEQSGINVFKNNNSKKNSFFFTGLDSIKSQSKLLGSSSSSSVYDDTTSKIVKPKEKKVAISLKQKEEFLEQNKNKLISIFSKYQNTLVKENDKNIYFQKKSLKKLRKAKSEIGPPPIINYQKKISNKINKIEPKKKLTSIDEESSSKRIPRPKLLDDNYEYDEEENFDEVKKNNLFHKKNEIKNYYSFFRLDKDRASIYKKMNDLRKLQMSYFGGRFLNTKIHNGPSSGGENNLDDFLNNYYKKQTHDQFSKNKKNRLLNYKKKVVFDITANKKFRSKTPYIGRNKYKNKDLNCFSEENRVKFKKINSFKKTDIKSKEYLLNNQRSTLTKFRTQRFIDKMKFPLFSKKPNNNRTLSPNNNNFYYHKKI